MADEKDDERLKALEERFVRATWRLSLDEVKRHVNEAVEDCKEIPSHSARASFLRKQEDVLRPWIEALKGPWIEALKVGDDIWDLPAAEIELERLTRLRVRTENLAMHIGEGSLHDADGTVEDAEDDPPTEEVDKYKGLPFGDDDIVWDFSRKKSWLPYGRTVLNADTENNLAGRKGEQRLVHIRARLLHWHEKTIRNNELDVAKFKAHHLTRIKDKKQEKRYE